MGVAQACHPTFTSAVPAASVFRKKSVAVCGFLAYFCAVLQFSDPLTPPSQRVNSANLHYFGVYTAAMGFTSDACWFLLIKMLLIKNNKKREAALKTEAGGDEKNVCFFLLGLTYM